MPRARSSPRRAPPAAGFTLTEMAVVLVIAGMLLGGMLLTLSAQVEQRNRSETDRKLEEAKELLVGFAIVNGRLPCPARFVDSANHSQGGESFCTTISGACTVTTTAPGDNRCSNYYDGFLPAVAIGYQPTDSSGFALDAWGQRIRYAVSSTTWLSTPFARFTKTHVANSTTAAWSISQTPNDLVVCSASPAVTTSTSCDSNTVVTNTSTVVAIVYSTGKNTASGGSGTNEARNLDGNALFVSRSPDSSDATGGEFDDQMAWITVGQLYGRLISAGVLP
jgi:prepilin-type N-terminal cleavage/methylation domain-containing protein